MKIETFPDRASWLKSRTLSLGASDSATICGVGYGSEYELWLSKVRPDLAAPDDEVPEYIEAGNFMEPAIIAWWQHRTLEKATPTPLTIIRNELFPWAHASPDALVGDDAGLDAKNASWFRASEFEDGATPIAHQVQGQKSCAVTGRARWHFAAVVGGNRLLVSTVERDEAFIEQLMATEQAWWERHVVGKTPPEPDGSPATRSAIHRLFPREIEGEVRALDASFLDLRDMLDAAQAEKKVAEDEIAEIQAKIKAAIGDAMYGVLPDGTRWRWKVEPRKAYSVAASEPRVLRFEKEAKR